MQVANTMAFNPQMFESVYGFSVLDEVHNFFPELLYDDAIFPSTIMQWMRHRVTTLFPAIYNRNRSLYSIYHANSRLRSYNQWRRESATPAPPLRRNYQTAQVPAATSVDISGAPVHGAGVAAPAAALPTQSVAAQRPARTPLTNLFTSVLWEPVYHEMPLENLLNLFNTAFTDVPVAPSQEIVERGSTIRPNNEIPADTTCSICQETAADDTMWRVLYCGHMYHKQCIDTWFTTHTLCPVCRADIRNYQSTVQQI